MNKLLLKKVEEFALYLIEKDKQVQSLQKQGAGLDKRLRSIALEKDVR